MKIKIVRLADPKAKKIIKDRFIDAVDFRQREKDYQWSLVEKVLFNRKSGMSNFDNDTCIAAISNAVYEINTVDEDGPAPDITINYAMRNVRMLHSQMCANPPVVSAKPATAGTVDKRRAEAANHVMVYGREIYNIQNHIELSTLSTIIYGTGYMLTTWDPTAGDFKEFDEETDEVTCEGDIRMYSPDVWNIWLDPKAERQDDIRYFIERLIIPCDLAESMFPNHYKMLEEQSSPTDESRTSRAQRKRNNSGKSEKDITVYRYYEKGLPINAMQGRMAFLDCHGDVIGEIKHNPYQFKTTKTDNEEVAKVLPSAILPLSILTEVDVPNQVYGKGSVDWSIESQDAMHRLDSMRMDNVRAAGTVRLLVPDTAEIDEDAITDCPYDIVKYTAGGVPSHMNPPQLYGDVNAMRETLRNSIDELSGINDAMLGQVERESSGYSLSFATNQANMIRRRLFNKYINYTKDVYKLYLSLAIKYWDEEKEISVLGPENMYETRWLSGADIQGGYDIFCEYGNTFSLDPAQRRIEMMEIKDVLLAGGMTEREFVEMLAIGDTKMGVDMMQISRKRQEEIFQIIIDDRVQVEPEEKQDHAGMLAYATKFVNFAEFRDLDAEQKRLIYEHIDLREQLVAKQQAADPAQAAGGAPAPDAAGGPAMPQGGMPIPMG